MSPKYPPGPANWLAPIGLTFDHALRLRWNPLPFLDGLRQYGDLAFFRLFGVRAYVANHPQLIREVLISKRQSFRKLPRDTRAVRQLLGDGIIISDGDFWLRQRRLVQTAFHHSRMAGYAQSTVQLTRAMLRRWSGQPHVEVPEEMTDLTMRIAAKTMFDLELHEGNADLVQAAGILSHTFLREIQAIIRLPDWLPLPHKRRKRWAMELYDRLIRRIIAERRASGEDRGDLLSQLLLAVDAEGDGRGMTIAQARDEAMTLFTAAFHANSMALTWTWYLLARHPQAARQLHEEVDRVLAGREPVYEDLERLPYTQMVIKESLRLYPPAWALFCREAVEDVELGGYTIGRGSWVFLYPYVTHRDARFFPDPLRFDPERFAADAAREIPPLAYFPFGAGPRACIGNTFAMMEMTLIVALMAQHFGLEMPADEPQRVAEARLAMRPKGGLRMRLVPRNVPAEALQA